MEVVLPASTTFVVRRRSGVPFGRDWAPVTMEGCTQRRWFASGSHTGFAGSPAALENW